MNGTDKKYCTNQSRDQDEWLDGAITQSSHGISLLLLYFNLIKGELSQETSVQID